MPTGAQQISNAATLIIADIQYVQDALDTVLSGRRRALRSFQVITGSQPLIVSVTTPGVAGAVTIANVAPGTIMFPLFPDPNWKTVEITNTGPAPTVAFIVGDDVPIEELLCPK